MAGTYSPFYFILRILFAILIFHIAPALHRVHIAFAAEQRIRIDAYLLEFYNGYKCCGIVNPVHSVKQSVGPVIFGFCILMYDAVPTE